MWSSERERGAYSCCLWKVLWKRNAVARNRFFMEADTRLQRVTMEELLLVPEVAVLVHPLSASTPSSGQARLRRALDVP